MILGNEYKKAQLINIKLVFPEVGMWPPKRWEIESGHIRISSWVQGERRKRRRRI
jgi:hypothetical protein